MAELEERAAFVDRGITGRLRSIGSTIRLLDTISIAIAALTAPPIAAIGASMDELALPSLIRNFTGERYRAELQ